MRFIYALIALVFLFIFGSSYVLGAMSYNHGIWPIPQLKALKRSTSPPQPTANGAVMDRFERLISYRAKLVVPCPLQTERTKVLFIAGQSNAANNGGQRYAGLPNVVNYFDGKCYAASSPLLGNTGVGGESWTLLGNKLIDAGKADHVVLIPSAVAGTSIVRWQEGGDLNSMLRSAIESVSPHYRITHVLWHQGEWDVGGMTKEQYSEKFMTIVHTIRQSGVDAPVFVSVATKCELTNLPYAADNQIALAHKSIPNPTQNIWQGVNTDDLLGPLDRMDDCHFAGSGQEKMASAWVDILSDDRRTLKIAAPAR